MNNKGILFGQNKFIFQINRFSDKFIKNKFTNKLIRSKI